MNPAPISTEVDLLASPIIDAVYHVRRNLGPELWKRVYEVGFCYELEKRNLNYLKLRTASSAWVVNQ